MGDITGTVRLIGDIMIAVVTALGSVWVLFRKTRAEAKVSMGETLESLVNDLNRERGDLLRMISELRQENTDLRKDLQQKKD